ncbi:hypothetical protein chiPu_0031903, partial [Chiloscyllium punctatum]|nr:hypothetical protein [Chiloscyllium punctatum]
MPSLICAGQQSAHSRGDRRSPQARGRRAGAACPRAIARRPARRC